MLRLQNLQVKLVLIFLLLIMVNSQCCLEFTNSLCTRCPSGMHLYRNNCIYNLPGCQTYSNGFDCQICSASYRLQPNGTCSKIGNNLNHLETLTISQLPTNGYSIIPQNNYANNAEFQKINSIISSLLSQQTGWKYSFVYWTQNQNIQVWRCII